MKRAPDTLALALVTAVLPLASACHGNSPADQAPLNAPVSEPIGLAADTVPLPGRALLLRSEVDSALAQGPGLDAQLIYRIASLSDRMAVTRLPFAWSRDRYDLGARVREIRALADRITAEVRRDVDPDSIRPDLLGLRAEIDRLRGELAQGGGPASPPLDSLMRGYPKEHTIRLPTAGGPVE